MADNVVADPGSGGAQFRAFFDGANEWPAAAVAYVTGGSAGAWTLQQVDSAHGLPVAVLGTVPVSGTFWQATQPVSAASLPLPTGAATAAKQPALGTAGSASADVLTVQGVAGMTALKVDGSAVTQPVSLAANVTVVGTGTFAVQAAQSGNWPVRAQDGAGNALTSAARGAQQALSVQIVDASGNQVTSFGGSGGTASNYGSAFPTTGTASGFTDGTNMQGARVFDADTGAGTQYVLGANLRISGSGGSVEAKGSATSANSIPVVIASDQGSYTVAATQSGAWNVGTVTTVTAVTSITNAVTVVGAAASGAAKGGAPVQVGAVFNTTQPTVTTGQVVEAQATARGARIVATGVDTFHVTVDNSTLAVTQSGSWSLAANQSVNLAQVAGAGTATGHGTASGAIRVELPTDGTGLVGAAQSGTWTVQPGNTANTTPWLVTPAPATSGGPTVARIKAASGTNATNVKASAGQVYGWALYNNAASMRAIHVYDSAGAPTAGSGTPKFTILVPASGGANVEWSMGVPFASGIGYTITTGASDTDTGSCTADDVHGMLLYK